MSSPTRRRMEALLHPDWFSAAAEISTAQRVLAGQTAEEQSTNFHRPGRVGCTRLYTISEIAETGNILRAICGRTPLGRSMERPAGEERR